MNIAKADAIIVLGRVDRHGHLTIDAHERIRHAAALYNNQVASTIVAPAKWWYKLTYTPPLTEAGMIKARLMEWGVPESAIECEEESCDTLGAAYFLKSHFVVPRKWKRIVVVTSLDHAKRTEYVFHKVFGDSIEIEYTWGNQVLSSREFEASLEREAKSLKLMDSTWIGPITPGNDSQVAEVLAMHPGYNPNSQITPEEIERRVQAQNVAA